MIFAILSLAAGWKSKGFLEGDACTHYLYSRFGFRELHLLLDVWGRPICTTLYALPALIGHRAGVRVMSMLIALAMGLVTWRIAKGQGYRWPPLALIFVLGQPIVFLHSFSELTELPFALLVALALWAYQKRRWFWLALVAGLMPAARPEGFGFLAIVAVGLILHRKWWWLPVLMVPVALWSFLGWLVAGMAQPWYYKWWHWLIEQWPYASNSLYPRGPLLHFVEFLPAIVGPIAFPALGLGIWLSLRRPVSDHRARVQWLIALLPLFVLAVHSYLHWSGKMASSGELRYLSVVAPMWGLLIAAGWEWVFATMNWRPVFLAAGIAVLAPILANVVYRVVPLKLSKEGMRSKEVAQWYASSPLKEKYPRLIATSRDVYYFLDTSPTNWHQSAEWQRKTIESHDDHAPTNDGILLIWDPIYGLYNSDSSRSMTLQQILASGWVPVKIFDTQPGQKAPDTAINRMAKKIHDDDLKPWIVFLSPKDNGGHPTQSAWQVPIPEPDR